MRTIRQILLTDYIGAILVGVLVADAFGALISAGVAQASYYYALTRQSVPDPRRLSTMYSVSSAVARIALFLISAYLIARWLYPAADAKSSTVPDKQSD